MAHSINKYNDIIDSRDVIARIKELEGEREALLDAVKEAEESAEDGDSRAVWDGSDGAKELADLKGLAEDGESSPDWKYGETLIRDSYFTEYAEQLADDIGAINNQAKWPLNHIDWDAAAQELKQDYISINFDGVTYWIRS